MQVFIARQPVFDRQENVSTGKPAFVNVTREVLPGRACYLLPVGLTIAEILETLEPGKVRTAACRDLEDAGFIPAPDDFAVACKRADRETVAQEARSLGRDEQRSWELLYLGARTWARETCGEGVLPV